MLILHNTHRHMHTNVAQTSEMTPELFLCLPGERGNRNPCDSFGHSHRKRKVEYCSYSVLMNMSLYLQLHEMSEYINTWMQI